MMEAYLPLCHYHRPLLSSPRCPSSLSSGQIITYSRATLSPGPETVQMTAKETMWQSHFLSKGFPSLNLDALESCGDVSYGQDTAHYRTGVQSLPLTALQPCLFPLMHRGKGENWVSHLQTIRKGLFSYRVLPLDAFRCEFMFLYAVAEWRVDQKLLFTLFLRLINLGTLLAPWTS